MAIDTTSKRILKTFCQSILREKAINFSSLDFLKKKFDPEKVEEVSVAGAIVLAQVAKAIEGDAISASWVRDTAGEKPSDKVEVGLLKEGEVVINLLSHGETLEQIQSVEPLQISDNTNKIK